MNAFVEGSGLTIAMCAFILLVFLAAWIHLRREITWVRVLVDQLGIELAAGQSTPGSLLAQEIRDGLHAVATAKDAAWAQKQVRTWQMRAYRLESALAFWTDLLRQLGLLGTVVGIGISLASAGTDVSRLVAPLALAVWTTVTGLASSILLSASFAMKLTAWVDACEKNLEAWDARRQSSAVSS